MIKRIRLSILLTVIISFFLFEDLATSKDKLNVVSFNITNMVESPTKGAFIEIARKAAERANIALNIRLYPPKRAQKEFNSDKFDMFFPAIDVNFPDLKKVIRSKALLDIKKDYAFVRKGTPIIKTLDGLRGKKVGLILGYLNINAITHSKDITIKWANTQSQNLKKVAEGRIDVVLGDWRSAEKKLLSLVCRTKLYTIKTILLLNRKYISHFKTMQNADLLLNGSRMQFW